MTSQPYSAAACNTTPSITMPILALYSDSRQRGTVENDLTIGLIVGTSRFVDFFLTRTLPSDSTWSVAFGLMLARRLLLSCDGLGRSCCRIGSVVVSCILVCPALGGRRRSIMSYCRQCSCSSRVPLGLPSRSWRVGLTNVVLCSTAWA